MKQSIMFIKFRLMNLINVSFQTFINTTAVSKKTKKMQSLNAYKFQYNKFAI